ncbi:ATP-binding protein [Cellulomonas endometrii]|uniref:ATP-binding protein n=1 Tax=Cellulomonas endometrii TaxID=3036301 RepID=UPI0024ACCCB7|nr:ATP-binding protein [Cellulomonas endometrii]
MDPRNNPYTPGAGTTPPALEGRAEQLERFEILLDRLAAGRQERSQLVTGLRGVGKTVLLNRFEAIAKDRAWVTLEHEVDTRTSLAPLMGRLCRRALYTIDRPARWGERARRAAQVLKAFTLTFDPDGNVTLGSSDLEPAEGYGDSGALAEDLTDVIVTLGEAARERRTGVVFLLDEVQYLTKPDFEAVILALHKAQQKNLPVTMVGAGLPQMPKLAGEAKSYAERLFNFPRIGALDRDAASEALIRPASELSVEFTSGAEELAWEFTEGYPYFIQEVGRAAWDEAEGDSVISADDMTRALPLVEAQLDESFFRVRVERTTELELAYLRAMAELGPGPQRSGEVATTLGYEKSEELGPTRSNLIAKGLIYTPSHGVAEFTVPQFDKYLRRRMPLEKRSPKRRTPAKRRA